MPLRCTDLPTSLTAPTLLATSQVVAVGSRSADSAARFAQEHGIPKSYGSYAEVAADPNVEAVYVCGFHPNHFESALASLTASKPTLVEKPIT
eukprot:gene7189-6792_t